MKRRLLILLSLMVLAVGTLYALNATSNAPNRVKNGFKRNFLPIVGVLRHSLEFATPVRELAGQQGDSLFLMTGEPGKVYVTNHMLQKPSTILLADPKIKLIIPRFYTTVQYPEIYILGGNAKEYAIGDLTNGKTRKQKLTLPGIFNNPVLVGENFIMRIVDNDNFDARFAVVNKFGQVLAWEQNLSQGSHDAGMVYSGLLKYDETNKQLVYTHYYDNTFDVFTPDLQLLYRGHTIDTVYHNPTEVVVVGKSVAHKHPPVRVNSYTAIYKGKLYVSSKLLADNEDKRQFFKNHVIDQYNLATGKYEGSFYLPGVADKPMAQFYFINDDTILAFCENKVLLYKLQTAIPNVS